MEIILIIIVLFVIIAAGVWKGSKSARDVEKQQK
jgi:hypothetical protein